MIDLFVDVRRCLRVYASSRIGFTLLLKLSHGLHRTFAEGVGLDFFVRDVIAQELQPGVQEMNVRSLHAGLEFTSMELHAIPPVLDFLLLFGMTHSVHSIVRWRIEQNHGKR